MASLFPESQASNRGVTYEPQGAPSQYTYGNGVSRLVAYNARLQPSTAVDGTGLTGSGANAAIGNPLFRSSWNWNFGSGGAAANDGNLAGDSYTHSGGGLASAKTFTHSFSYDGVNRLTQAGESGHWQRGFAYDPWGNPWVNQVSGLALGGNTPTTNVYDPNTNRDTRWQYDGAGNLLQANGDTLSYDAESRMIGVAETGASETIGYDGAGNRVQKAVNGGATTVYVYDAFGVLSAEYSSGTVGTPPCATCYLSMDQIGSTRLVTGATGNVVARHDFLPFGQEITTTGGRTGQWGATGDVEQKFTGQIRDTESGLDYFTARYYTSGLQRFNSPDPANAGADLTSPQSWNGYSYVGNSPLSAIDPLGLARIDCGNGVLADACVSAPAPDPIDPLGWVSFGGYGPLPGSSAYGFGGGGGAVFRATGLGKGDVSTLASPSNTPPNKGTNTLLACAAEFGQNHSIAAAFGLQHNFVANLFAGNSASGLANLYLLAAGAKTPTVSQLAAIPLKGAAQGIPVPPGNPGLSGAVGQVRGIAVQGGASAVYNASTGAGAEPIELGLSAAGAIATPVAELSSQALTNTATGVGVAKFAFDLTTFAYGYAFHCH